MIPVKHLDPDDLPLYAMHLLSPEDTDALTQLLQENVEARQRLSEIYGELATLAYTVDLQEPAATAREELLKQIAREKKVVAIDRTASSERSTSSTLHAVPAPRPAGGSLRVLPWIGWAVAAGLAVEAGFLFDQKRNLEHDVAAQRAELANTMTADQFSNLLTDTLKDPSAQNVVLTRGAQTAPPQGRAIYSAQKGSLIFIATNLQPLDPAKTYELWLLPSNGQSPVPAGLFQPDAHGNASVLLPRLPQGMAAKGFGVTIENEAGSPVPTTPIILQGSAV